MKIITHKNKIYCHLSHVFLFLSLSLVSSSASQSIAHLNNNETVKKHRNLELHMQHKNQHRITTTQEESSASPASSNDDDDLVSNNNKKHLSKE